MAQDPFGEVVQSEAELREVVPSPAEDSPPLRK
jgi:predicted pyridoxine 5'-phosphate oxidase superfamily flavin-nucleotide-binding protein